MHVNRAFADSTAPFGGYMHSGHGREWGAEGMLEYLEVEAMFGAVPAAA